MKVFASLRNCRASHRISTGSEKFAVERVEPGGEPCGERNTKIRVRIRLPTRGNWIAWSPDARSLLQKVQYCVVPCRGGFCICGFPARSTGAGCVHASRYPRKRYVFAVAVPTEDNCTASAESVISTLYAAAAFWFAS